MPREGRQFARRSAPGRAPRKMLAPPVTGAARRAILRARREEQEDEVDSGYEDVYQVFRHLEATFWIIIFQEIEGEPEIHVPAQVAPPAPPAAVEAPAVAEETVATAAKKEKTEKKD